MQTYHRRSQSGDIGDSDYELHETFATNRPPFTNRGSNFLSYATEPASAVDEADPLVDDNITNTPNGESSSIGRSHWQRAYQACKRGFDAVKLALHKVYVMVIDWTRMQRHINQLYFYATLLVTITNIYWTVRTALNSVSTGQGMVQVAHGNCASISRKDTMLHLIINILSTLLLWATNHCMQLLLAPTRAELNHAHKRGLYFDIGVPSFKNFWRIPKARRNALTSLFISSTLLHLFWNSVIFSTRPTTSYSFAMVTSDYMTNRVTWPTKNGDALGLQTAGYTYEKLTPGDCLYRYGDMFSPGLDLVVVTAGLSTDNLTGNGYTSLLAFGSTPGSAPANVAAWWTCWAYREFWRPGSALDCNLNNMKSYATNWTVGVFGSQGVTGPYAWRYPVEFCLSAGVQDFDNKCGLFLSWYIMVVVCVINIVQCFYCAQSLFDEQEDTDIALILFGDAIQSFLEDPDTNTRDCPLLVHAEVDDMMKRRSRFNYSKRSGPRQWCATKNSRWYHAVGRRDFVFILSLCVFGTACVGALLGCGLRTQRDRNGTLSPSSIWSYGFGKQFDYNTFTGILNKLGQERSSLVGFFVSVLVANSPQVLLAVIMQTMRSQLCAMHMAVDWCDFSCGRNRQAKFTWPRLVQQTLGRLIGRSHSWNTMPEPAGRPLRVSFPEDGQEAPYLLSMPAQYALLIMGGTTLVHWLLSQSLFVSKTVNYDANNYTNSQHNDVYIGFSVLAAAFAFPAATVVTVMYFMLGWQRLPSGEGAMPLVGVCSLATSAACHPPSNQLGEFWTKRVV